MFFESDSIEDFKHRLQSLQVKETLVVFVGEHNSIPLGHLIEALKDSGVPFFGGLFPAVFSEQGYSETGIILKDIPIMGEVLHTHSLSSPEELDELELVASQYARAKTALVLLDGLSAGISQYMTKLYDCFGTSLSYIGGGAGSLSLKQQPCLFNAEGVFEDGAFLAFSSWEVKLGVHHGWERIAGPFVVTEAAQTTVKQLNWSSAFSIYRQFVEEDSKEQFNDENFFEIAKRYPFGMQKQHQEYVVRDPITTNEDGHLICVGKVPEHAVLDILKGSTANLVEAARKASLESIPQDPAFAKESLVIDCISRVLFLENDFQKEIAAIKESWEAVGLPVEGVLTLGEISSSGDGLLEFYNKTIVSGVFSE